MFASYLAHVILHHVWYTIMHEIMLTFFTPEYPDFNTQSSFWFFLGCMCIMTYASFICNGQSHTDSPWKTDIKSSIIHYFSLTNVKPRENYKNITTEQIIGNICKQKLI